MAVEMMGTEILDPATFGGCSHEHVEQEFLSTTDIITTNINSFRKFFRTMYLVVVMSAVERWKAFEVLGGK